MSTLFHRMTSRSFGLSEVLVEMNAELRVVLPSRLFCAAVAFELDPSRSTLTVCNAGMPDAYVVGREQVTTAPSMNVPLAVIDRFEPRFQTFEVCAGDRIVAVSDGIVESMGPHQEMFGGERVKDILVRSGHEQGFASVLAAVKAFTEGLQSDDVSLAEVCV
jgi:serine phosphatase RsbU (regulator of sigma subunit)